MNYQQCKVFLVGIHQTLLICLLHKNWISHYQPQFLDVFNQFPDPTHPLNQSNETGHYSDNSESESGSSK